MKVTTIKFKGINYQVFTGDVFQAKLDNGIKGQIFIVQCNDNEKVTLEVVDKISNHLVLMRVNSIEWGNTEEVKKENYEEVIKEPEIDIRSIDNMTKKELINFAKSNDIPINKKSNKSKLLEEIKNYCN